MAINFSVKIGEIGLFIFIVALAFGNGLQYRTPDATVIWLHPLNIW